MTTTVTFQFEDGTGIEFEVPGPDSLLVQQVWDKASQATGLTKDGERHDLGMCGK